MRFPIYEKRAIHLYPRSICQLRSKHLNLMTRWNDLTAEVESINDLGRQTWSGAFSLVCVQADKLLEEQDSKNMETIKQCIEIIKHASRDKLLPKKYLKVKAELEQSWALFQEKADSKVEEPVCAITPLDLKCTDETYPAIPVQSLSSTMSSLSSPTLSASTRDTPILATPSPILKYNGLSPIDISFIKTEVELVFSPRIDIMPSIDNQLSLLSPIQIKEKEPIKQDHEFDSKIETPKPVKSKPKPIPVVIHPARLSQFEVKTPASPIKTMPSPMKSSVIPSTTLAPQVISTFPMLSPRTLHSSPLFPNLDFLTAAFGQDGFEADFQSFIEKIDQASGFEPFGPPPLSAKSTHREYSLYHHGAMAGLKSPYFASPPPLSPVPRRGRLPLPTIIDGDIQDWSNPESTNRRRMSTSMVNENEDSNSPSLLAIMSTPRRNTIEHGELVDTTAHPLPCDWNLRSVNPAPNPSTNSTDTALQNTLLEDPLPCDPLHKSLVSLPSPHLPTHSKVHSLPLSFTNENRLVSVAAPSVSRDSLLEPLQLPLRISSLRT